MQRKHDRAKQAPGPKGHVLLGSIPEFKHDILQAIEAARQVYGDMVRFKLGPKTVYVVCSPELADEVLVRQKDIFVKMGTNAPKPVGLQLLIGNGLLTNPEYDSWLVQRRLIQPMFHRRSIATMTDQMVAAGGRMLARWHEVYAPGDVVDVADEMMRVTLDIISRTLFSTDVTDQTAIIGRAVREGTAFIFQRNQNPFSLPLALPTPRNQSFKQARQGLDRVIYAVLDQRLSSGEKHGDLLDMLIDARDADSGAGMTRAQLRDEIATMFLAGHETTAHTLTWAWYLLSQHPEVLRKLHHEVDTMLQGRAPTLDDLQALPYTAAVFDETLRLFPAAPALVRRAAQNTTLGGYAIAAGAQVFVSVYSIQRRAESWDAPETFRPERFLPDQQADRHPLAFIPFGAGQRKCIGANFALIEGQILLAMLAQRYELRLTPDQQVAGEVAITLRPRYGMRMHVHPRPAHDSTITRGSQIATLAESGRSSAPAHV